VRKAGREDTVSKKLEAAEQEKVVADVVFFEEHTETCVIDEAGLCGENIGE